MISRYKNAHNVRIKNWGYASKDALRAATNAIKENFYSFTTQQNYIRRFSLFVLFLKDELHIKDLTKCTRDDVLFYASYLLEKYENNELSVSTIHDYLSCVNAVLEVMSNHKRLIVNPVEDSDFPRRSGICKESRANSLVPSFDEKLNAIINLQLELGLRFEESLKFNAFAAIKQAIREQKIVIEYGTKGGLTRELEVTTEQMNAIEIASKLQEKNSNSLIPHSMNYIEYKRQLYAKIRSYDFRFHGQRHAFAHRRYKELTIFEAPVLSHKLRKKKLYEYMSKKLNVSIEKARDIEINARLQISRELGHQRSAITDSYLG